jgi:hypothetical protein
LGGTADTGESRQTSATSTDWMLTKTIYEAGRWRCTIEASCSPSGRVPNE